MTALLNFLSAAVLTVPFVLVLNVSFSLICGSHFTSTVTRSKQTLAAFLRNENSLAFEITQNRITQLSTFWLNAFLQCKFDTERHRSQSAPFFFQVFSLSLSSSSQICISAKSFTFANKAIHL